MVAASFSLSLVQRSGGSQTCASEARTVTGPIGVSLPHRARDVRSVGRVHLEGSTERRREAGWRPEL